MACAVPPGVPSGLRRAGQGLAAVDGEAPRRQGQGAAGVRLAQLAAVIDAEASGADLPEMVRDLEVREEAREFVETALVHLEHQKVDEQRVHDTAVGTGSNAKRVAPVVYLVRDDVLRPEVDRQVVADDPGRRVAMGARNFGAGASAASRIRWHHLAPPFGVCVTATDVSRISKAGGVLSKRHTASVKTTKKGRAGGDSSRMGTTSWPKDAD